MSLGKTNKVPLNGADSMMLAFDHQMRRLGFAGNQAQIMLELSGRLSESDLENRLHEIRARFSILSAKIKRKIAPVRPCWLLPYGGKTAHPRVRSHKAGDEKELHRIRCNILNHPFDIAGGELVRIDLVHKQGRDTELIMTWSHILMDVTGAQYLLGIIGQSIPAENNKYTQAELLSGGYTERLVKGVKWQQTKKFFQRVDELAEHPPVSLYTRAGKPLAPGFDYRLLSFSPEQTRAIFALAEKKSGFLNSSAFYMAAVMGQFHRLLQSRQIASPGYVVPVSVDLRKKGTHLPVFGNQAATLMCGFTPDQLSEFDLILETFKQQTQEAVRRDLIYSNICAMEFACFIPPRLYAAKMKKAFSGETASFVFANPGAAPGFLYEFMGHEVKSLHHVPSVVVPPGMGIVFYIFSGRLHISLVYVDSLLGPDEAEAFLAAVGNNLKAGLLT
ncbi:MAG: hypothetical protein ACOC8R_02650 [Desulfosalsimonas sp.]